MDKKIDFIKQAKGLRKKVRVIHEEIYKAAYEAIFIGLPKMILSLDKLLTDHPLIQEGYPEKYALELKRVVLAGWVDDKEIDEKLAKLPPLSISAPIPVKRHAFDRSMAVDIDTLSSITRQALMEESSRDTASSSSSSSSSPFMKDKDVSFVSQPKSISDISELWRVRLLKDAAKPIVELIDLLKTELVKIADHLSPIKMMLQLRMPKIEGGQDFGVSVQTNFLTEVGRAEDAVLALRDECLQYHRDRANRVEALMATPSIKDLYLMMLQLRMPKIEGGQDFGVSVQTNFLTEVGRAEDAVLALRDECLQYHRDRANRVEALMATPSIKDLYLVMIGIDEKELSEFRSSLRDLRNILIILCDQLKKNEEMILKVHKDKNGQLVM
ncbi:Proteasome activator PA28 like protein [Aduncisulcus paluster]|uniref:Proteasome activator PA28 like protein n=1 Tax=Aduncisulcus paluster TaxID=2918883 RepID=A0ABQ5K4H9_9EUKA|nr:Proteasome activator PA28 like protein [Aduncisulcus paluster]